ncbi:MAG: class I SAM-dependent methyltransferase [Chloroflexota bacterium]|nr:class I SAM-dependent methyltransferase [Chloroflexota bacterium]
MKRVETASESSNRSFDELIAEALEADFSGWDFSWLDGRWIDGPLPWNFRERIERYLPDVNSLYDMGTGGGEFLASLAPLPPDTWASENWSRNLPIARARLEPLGVTMVSFDSIDQLPFPDDAFDLVINRHEGYAPAEVLRILKPGGRFITQQVGGRNEFRLNELLQEDPYFKYEDWVLANAVADLEEGSFQVTKKQEAFPEARVTDIGAVVYYLRAIPWQIEDFSVERYRERLLAVHNMIQEEGYLSVHSHRFYVEAVKPV